MKRIKKEFYVRLPPVRLYLDDIEYIIDQLHGFRVKLQHEDYEYESIPELTASVSREAISQLKIAGDREFSDEAYVYIEPMIVRISGRGAGIERAAVIAHGLKAKTPWYLWQPSNSTLRGFITGAASMALMIALGASATVLYSSPSPLGLIILALCLLGTGRLFFLRLDGPTLHSWLDDYT
jgi:hypothetical protein